LKAIEKLIDVNLLKAKYIEYIIPKEKHIQLKAETFATEGYNSLLSHFLARMRRKSKCYFKIVDRLREVIIMLMLKRNNQFKYTLLTMPNLKIKTTVACYE